LDTNGFILGAEVAALEKELAVYCGTKHAIGCASGTDALLLALMAFDIQEVDEVITTPHTFIAIVRGPENTQARAAFQHQLVSTYPNVSAIDVREVLASVQDVVQSVTLAVSIVGGIALFGGVLILAGAVAMTKFQRVYEAAILRTLGASSRTLTMMLASEYTALGLLAGMIGALGALALSWAVCRFVFEIDWSPAPGLLIGGAAITTVMVAVIGVVASRDVLRKKPLATLRAE
jgi:putative ABC transport system permease protein